MLKNRKLIEFIESFDSLDGEFKATLHLQRFFQENFGFQKLSVIISPFSKPERNMINTGTADLIMYWERAVDSNPATTKSATVRKSGGGIFFWGTEYGDHYVDDVNFSKFIQG